jgi:hypothetical protein
MSPLFFSPLIMEEEGGLRRGRYDLLGNEEQKRSEEDS